MIQEILSTAIEAVSDLENPLYRRQASLDYLLDVGYENIGTVLVEKELLDLLTRCQSIIIDEDIAIIRAADEHEEGHKSTPKDVSAFFKDVSKLMGGVTKVAIEKQKEAVDESE